MPSAIEKLREIVNNAFDKFSNKFPKIHSFLKKFITPKNVVLTISLICILFVTVCTTLFFVRRSQSIAGIFAGDWTKSPVEKVRVYASNSGQAIRDDKSSDLFAPLSFKDVDPITVYVSVKMPEKKDELNLRFQLLNLDTKTIARESFLPFSTISNENRISERFVSLVLSDQNALAKGHYCFKLYSDDFSEIASRNFQIVETKSPK